MLNENSQIICTIQLQESLSMNSTLLEVGVDKTGKKKVLYQIPSWYLLEHY